MKKIEDLKDLDQKKVLVRFDLNVPLKDGRITDPTRIIKIIPTLKFLIKCKAKIIIISHVGRPKGKINKDLSMQPICEYLSTKLGKKVELLKKISLILIVIQSSKIIMMTNFLFLKI